MEIIVNGTGSDYFVPNEVILNINFKVKSDNYEMVLLKGTTQVDLFINEILLKNDFKKDDLKTRSFVIRKVSKYNEDTKSYDFDGYFYNQGALLKFDYDIEKLAKIMEEISKLDDDLIYQVNFGIKNEKECRKIILSKAYQDAYEKANAIALASNKTLKQCLKVTFEQSMSNYVSQSMLYSENIHLKSSLSANQGIINTFTPEDIELSETLYCVWIAE